MPTPLHERVKNVWKLRKQIMAQKITKHFLLFYLRLGQLDSAEKDDSIRSGPEKKRLIESTKKTSLWSKFSSLQCNTKCDSILHLPNRCSIAQGRAIDSIPLGYVNKLLSLRKGFTNAPQGASPNMSVREGRCKLCEWK